MTLKQRVDDLDKKYDEVISLIKELKKIAEAEVARSNAARSQVRTRTVYVERDRDTLWDWLGF